MIKFNAQNLIQNLVANSQGTPAQQNAAQQAAVNNAAAPQNQPLAQANLPAGHVVTKQYQPIEAMCGTKITMEKHYDQAGELVGGSLVVETWLSHNQATRSQMQGNSDIKVIFDLGKKFRDLQYTDQTGIVRDLTTQEKETIIDNFYEKINFARQGGNNPNIMSNFRGRIKLEEAFKPKLDKLDGLFLLDDSPKFVFPSTQGTGLHHDPNAIALQKAIDRINAKPTVVQTGYKLALFSDFHDRNPGDPTQGFILNIRDKNGVPTGKKYESPMYNLVSDCADILGGARNYKVIKCERGLSDKEIKKLINNPDKARNAFTEVDVLKDDDMFRYTSKVGKQQISDQEIAKRRVKGLHYHADGNNRAFNQIGIGSHSDNMNQVLGEAIRLLAIFAEDPVIPKDKCIWAESPYAHALMNAVNPARPTMWRDDQGRERKRPEGMGFLGMYFAELKDVFWPMANIAGHWAGCTINNSILAGTANGAVFINCEVGSGLIGWLKGERTRIWFKGSGPNKEMSGSASGVKISGGHWKVNLELYGGISSGELMAKSFRAKIQGMREFMPDMHYFSKVMAFFRMVGMKWDNDTTTPFLKNINPQQQASMNNVPFFSWLSTKLTRYKMMPATEFREKLRKMVSNPNKNFHMVKMVAKDTGELVPLGIAAEPYRDVFLASTSISGQHGLNTANVEILWRPWIDNHWEGCDKEQGSVRLVTDRQNVPVHTIKHKRMSAGEVWDLTLDHLGTADSAAKAVEVV